MKHFLKLTLLTAFLSINGIGSTVFSDDNKGTEYLLYFMGGQSNMEGFGYNKDLPIELKSPNTNVMIFHGNLSFDNKPNGGLGVWSPLQPGHGTGSKSDGIVNTLSNRFGPELSFGDEAHKLSNKKIAIIKYAAGGTALYGGTGYGNWDPDFDTANGINQYDNALTAIRMAMSKRDIDGDGKLDTLMPTGIIWMQGEADAYEVEEAAINYERNLKQIMDLLRAALHRDDLPVIIGKINDSGMSPKGYLMKYVKEVQSAQQAFVNNDKCAIYVQETEQYAFIEDGWHYDSSGFINMGKAFASAADKLHKKCK